MDHRVRRRRGPAAQPAGPGAAGVLGGAQRGQPGDDGGRAADLRDRRTYVTGIFEGHAPVRFTEVQGTGHVYQPGAADLIWNRFFSQISSGSGACAPCPTDLDRNDATEGPDLGLLLGAWGTGDATADLDGNGTVSASDLGMLLAAWGPC